MSDQLATKTTSIDINTDTHIVVPKDQLQKLIQQRKDLTKLFEAGIGALFIISDVMGGKIPRTPYEAVKALPKIMKVIKSDSKMLTKFGPILETMQAIAPQFMSEAMQEEFAAKFPIDTKSAENGA